MIRVVAVVLLALCLGAGGAGAVPPVITVPADMTVEATSAAGADVSYSVSAVNAGGQPVDLACSPPEGASGRGTLTATAPLPFGTTTVTCSVVDASTGAIDSQASFLVTVADSTAPTLGLPASFSVDADSSSGATVHYSVSAFDAVDGALEPSCSPSDGSVFPIGVTSVRCSATDSHGNSSTGSFDVTVNSPFLPPSPLDTTPPVFTNVPGPLVVEATQSSGAAVSYDLPTATDAHDGPIGIVTCSPRPGALFPVGQTTVVCNATDDAGNSARTTFIVGVVDTTPPSLSVPETTSVYATGADGIAASSPAAAAFLTSATAHDTVDPSPSLKNDAPVRFPVGRTIVTFSARDASGNTSSRNSTLNVLAPPATPSGSPTPLPPPVVKQAPSDASGFAAKAGRGLIQLRWMPANVAGFDHFELARAQASAGTAETVVFRGKATSFIDRKVQDGQLYRYKLTVVTTDALRSTGIALTAFAQSLRLLAPLEGATLRKPPQFHWQATAGASYYNLQLYRGTVKVLSIWPGHANYRLPRVWRYLGRSYRFVPGSYRWYVWPGLGMKAARKYGPLLGQASFSATP